MQWDGLEYLKIPQWRMAFETADVILGIDGRLRDLSRTPRFQARDMSSWDAFERSGVKR